MSDQHQFLMPSTVTISAVVTKQSLKKDGTYPIRIRVTFKRKYKLLSTNLVAEKRQLSRSLEITDPVLSDSVSTIVRQMRGAVNTLNPYELESMDVSDVVSRIEKALSHDNGKAFSLDFPDYCEKVVANKSRAARMNYICAIHALSDFLGTAHFDISVISSSMMRRFEQHLRDKHGDSARAVTLYTSAIAAVHKKAREEFNNEESDEVNIKNPFDYYKCPKRVFSAEHRDIDIEIVKQMLSMRDALIGRERLGVDLFLISFALMGMNTPDIYKCVKPKDGIITYNRTKTMNSRPDKAEMRVRIEPCVEPLLTEYKDGGRLAFNFHERYSTYENLGRAANIGLKAFSERIGVPKIDFYSARHTWATIARSKQVNIDKSTVNDCLCHVDVSMRVTDIYVKKDWSLLWDANAKVLALFDWPGQHQNESS